MTKKEAVKEQIAKYKGFLQRKDESLIRGIKKDWGNLKNCPICMTVSHCGECPAVVNKQLCGYQGWMIDLHELRRETNPDVNRIREIIRARLLHWTAVYKDLK